MKTYFWLILKNQKRNISDYGVSNTEEVQNLVDEVRYGSNK